MGTPINLTAIGALDATKHGSTLHCEGWLSHALLMDARDPGERRHLTHRDLGTTRSARVYPFK